jgi:pimeloyl-ACP methyl ester carboxylesterase
MTTQKKEYSGLKNHLKPELKTVLVNGASLHYLDIGKGEPVVFVHGTLGDYRTWEAQINPFAQDYRVIAYSRRFAYPNEQDLNESNDYSVTAHSKDLTQFLKTLDIGPVHLVGHSYGAFTSLMTAIEHPELLRSLTLGEPPVMSLLQNIPDGDKIGNDFVAKVFIPTAEAFNNNNDKKAVELFIGGVLMDSLYFSQAPQQQKDIMMDNIFELRAVVSEENIFPPLDCEEIKTLKMPVLLIKGNNAFITIQLFFTTGFISVSGGRFIWDWCCSTKRKG